MEYWLEIYLHTALSRYGMNALYQASDVLPSRSKRQHNHSVLHGHFLNQSEALVSAESLDFLALQLVQVRIILSTHRRFAELPVVYALLSVNGCSLLQLHNTQKPPADDVWRYVPVLLWGQNRYSESHQNYPRYYVALDSTQIHEIGSDTSVSPQDTDASTPDLSGH